MARGIHTRNRQVAEAPHTEELDRQLPNTALTHLGRITPVASCTPLNASAAVEVPLKAGRLGESGIRGPSVRELGGMALLVSSSYLWRHDGRGQWARPRDHQQLPGQRRTGRNATHGL